MRLNCGGLGTGFSRSRILAAFALLSGLGALTLSLGRLAPPLQISGADGASPFDFRPLQAAPRVEAVHSHPPTIFEPNLGQSDREVRFLARSPGFGVFLTRDEAVLALRPPVSSGRSGNMPYVVRMKVDGANPNAVAAGSDLLPGKSNYFIGNDPARWHRDVPQFAGVRYQQVYPAIDLVYYGNQGRLEYDFELAPGADPRRIRLSFRGTDHLVLDADGNLRLVTRRGDLRLEAPHVYQRFAGEKHAVPARFVLRGEVEVSFEVGRYDRSRALVIDPVLSFSTFLGGTDNEACSLIAPVGIYGVPSPPAGCPSVAVDAAQNMYIAGATQSADFPLTPQPLTNPPPTAFQTCLDDPTNPSSCTTLNGSPSDAFVTKLDSTGAIVFSTYLGGSDVDYSAGVAVDANSNVFVSGTTSSTNFPTLNGSQLTATSGQHAFLSELDPTGHSLIYSTYLAGSGTDTATGLALDVKGKAYISGRTNSPNFPTTAGAFQTPPDFPKAANQFFMSKIDTTLTGTSSLAYSTYIGPTAPGSGNTFGGGITVDANPSPPSVYLTGGTDFTAMPVVNAFQGKNGGGIDAWVAKFTPTNAPGSQEVYFSYLGGTGDEIGNAVAVDSGGSAYITGSISSASFNPTLPSGTVPFQATSGGGTDAFLGKFGPQCTAVISNCPVVGVSPLTYFSYLGGSGTDVGLGIVIDTIQGAHITGWTNSPNFPTPGFPLPPPPKGTNDAFVSRIDTTATSATAPGHAGTYLGGSMSDFGTSIASDLQGNTYVVGETFSADFPTKNPLPPGTLQGTTDAFVTRLSPTVKMTVTATASPVEVGMGNPVSFIYTITNNDELTPGVTFTDTVGCSGSVPVTVGTVSPSPGTCSSAFNGTVQCNIGTLNAGQVATVTVPLTPVAPTIPNPSFVTLTNCATASAPGASAPPASASARVDDFSVSVSPNTATVAAGVPATYNVTVTPTGNIPNEVSLAAGSGLPAGATPSFLPNASFPTLSNGAASRTLVINTMPRVTTPASLFRTSGPFYATWLPVSGLAVLGVGMGRKKSRPRRLLMLALLGGFFALVLFQAACGSSSPTSTTTGTPAGTYPITVTATSGTAAHTQQITLVVQ